MSGSIEKRDRVVIFGRTYDIAYGAIKKELEAFKVYKPEIENWTNDELVELENELAEKIAASLLVEDFPHAIDILDFFSSNVEEL
jgi:hypothetical protein